MGKIEIHYNGRTPEIRQAEEVVSGQLRSMEVQFTFSEDWEAYPLRTAVFKSRRASRMWPLDGEGKAKIPGDVIRTGVRSITVSVFGFAEMEGGEYLRYNGKPAAFRVEIGGDIPGEGCPDADPTAYELIMISLSAKLDANQGIDNAGRVLVVGEDGIVRPGEYSGGGGSGGNLPPGGKAGQILYKKSDKDFDVEWDDIRIPEEYGLVTYDQNRTITIS